MQITTNIEPELYDQASKVIGEIGLTVDDALRILLTCIAKEKTFLSLLLSNAETASAIEEAEKGGLPSAKSIDELMEKLNEGDWVDI